MESKSSRNREWLLANLFVLTLLILMASRTSGSAENSTNGIARTLLPETKAMPSSLREKFAKQFLMGVALDGELPGNYNAAEHQLIKTEFNAVTPANVMKMVELQSVEGRFDFRRADALVRYAAANGQKVCGHTLVWPKDERTPEWFFKDGDKPASRELLLRRMRTHIETVAKHFRGKVISWDVVNEPIGDGTNYLRPSKWLEIAGPEFIAEAFKIARAADPDAMLVLNDYDFHWPAKRPRLLRLLDYLREQNAPVDCVGMQGHFELDKINFQDVEETIVEIKKRGLKVAITELDIDAVGRSKWWQEDGKYRDELSKFDPYAPACPPDVLARQAEQFAKLFEIFQRHSDCIVRVSFWDLHDGKSWLNTFPWTRVNHPTFFNREAKPKPAYDAVMALPMKTATPSKSSL